MADRGPDEGERHSGRYEPLPGLTALPSRIWRRMGRGLRIAVGAALLGAVALAAVLSGGISESKREAAESERRERAERRERLVRRLEREQRPRVRRSASVAAPAATAADRLTARGGLVEELAAEVVADARLRVRRGELDGPIRRVDCEPFPRTVEGVGAEDDLSHRRGRYSCLAVTAEAEGTEDSVGVVTGHQYRAFVDFATGRYAFCKVSGQSGPTRDPLVTTPRACGGGT